MYTAKYNKQVIVWFYVCTGEKLLAKARSWIIFSYRHANDTITQTIWHYHKVYQSFILFRTEKVHFSLQAK